LFLPVRIAARLAIEPAAGGVQTKTNVKELSQTVSNTARPRQEKLSHLQK
jgi:hypothetical protein